ncbi:MAG: MgtC/SapB family protein [Candidatus Omnitrophota bacterium]
MISDFDLFSRILIAFVLSGLIGLEREFFGHEAGLRTHILVCVGSTLIMLTALSLSDIYKSQLLIDPSRIAANVVTGIGFLGAGAIMRSQEGVRGLTTASSLWVVAALGLSVGCGFLKISVFVTLVVLSVLWFLRKIEKALLGKGVDNGS